MATKPGKMHSGSSTYPEPKAQRSGCKVSWYYYEDITDARKAAKVAEKEARKLAQQGYDFGFQVPGWIEGPLTDGEYENLYSVVIP